jgi:hypothetical protein
VREATSNTTRHRGRILLLGIVVVLLIAELGTRAIASGLPAPLLWQSYETQRKVEQIDALAHQGGARIVFVGSSLVDVGVEPKIVDQQIGGGVTSYDAGLASSIPRMTKAWAETIVIPKLRPRVLVIGVGPYDIGAEGGSGRTAFLDAFLNSPGAIRAMHKEDPIQAANRWIGEYSSLWYNKTALRDPETVWRAITKSPQPTQLEAADLDAQGRETEDQYYPFSNQARVNVSDWSFGAKDVAAIKELIAYAHHRGMEAVLVDMPVTNQEVDRMPPGTFKTFQNALAAIGAGTGTKVLSYDAIRSDSLFLDDIHLNHAGADLFSTALGRALKPLVRAAH